MISPRVLGFIDAAVLASMRAALAGRDDEIASLSLKAPRNGGRAGRRADGHQVGHEVGSEARMGGPGSAGVRTACVLLTVTCYTFRMLLVMQFARDRATLEHLARSRGKDAAGVREDEFDDLIRECANMCCGTLNRSLGEVFPHLGMSTPIVLDHRSIEHLGALGFEKIQHYELLTDQGTRIVALLGIADFAKLDFEPPVLEAVAASGELEIF